jgi:hypothetical protein
MMSSMKNRIMKAGMAFAATIASLLPCASLASSHMDAPLITLDPSANTADVYAFRSQADGLQYLTVALTVYPFEEPGIGPNKYNFDDNVLYNIHVSTGADLATGTATYTYQFKFTTFFKSQATILQSYLGVINNVDDASQNLTQRYTVTRIHRGRSVVVGGGVVPPNNQGIATPFYNQGDNGDNPARSGALSAAQLDRYTGQSIAQILGIPGATAFCGQRDDGFYGDIQGVFDLLALGGPNKPFDSQSGFNIHSIVLNLPLGEFGADRIAGVYATTSRRSLSIVRSGNKPTVQGSKFVQVARQGNPLFCEALVALVDKDLYSRSSPSQDEALFSKYAVTCELGSLLNALVLGGTNPEIGVNRTDLKSIFIPDLIRVDLSTGPARLAGPPDDAGFSRLSVFGGDTLTSALTGGQVAGGWPNGRRFGDDVIDIAIDAILAPLGATSGDTATSNDIAYNRVFPYAATPHNGRNHDHH